MASLLSSSGSRSRLMMLVLLMLIMASDLMTMPASADGDFYSLVDLTWGEEIAQVHNNGHIVTLSMDNNTGSAFQSKDWYLFGRIDMQMKLVPNNSAGTVTTLYLSSEGDAHDEIDLEFLGNLSGQPYKLHTNIFANGTGGREQQFNLWFDATTSFHIYSIVWNPLNIIILVDNIPIRVFNNDEAIGVPYPNSQPMRVYASLWCGDSWATEGGAIKTNWSDAPFKASYKNFKVNANCVTSSSSYDGSSPSYSTSPCATSTAKPTNISVDSNQAWRRNKLNAHRLSTLRWMQSDYCVYNYCTDTERFPQGFPPECNSKTTTAYAPSPSSTTAPSPSSTTTMATTAYAPSPSSS